MKLDGVLELQEAIFLAVFAILVFVVPALVVLASYNPRMRLDVTTLWTHQERIDKFAVILLGTWWVHSCSMIMWTLLRVVQTQDYVTYMGWALPIMAKMWAPKAETPPTDKP